MLFVVKIVYMEKKAMNNNNNNNNNNRAMHTPNNFRICLLSASPTVALMYWSNLISSRL
jgi:hypothetical protein